MTESAPERFARRQSQRVRGWYNMLCWNGLSAQQQQRLIRHGNLPFGFVGLGTCDSGAEVEILTMWDVAPGPRFYCRACAKAYMDEVGP